MRSKILVFLGSAALLAAFSQIIAYRLTERTVTARVLDKERIDRNQEDSRFLVFTDVGEFEVVDTWAYLDWRASSRYGAIPRGVSCEFRVAGWRWGFMSWYPNIVEVRKCSS